MRGINYSRRRFISDSVKMLSLAAAYPWMLSLISCASDPFRQSPDEFTLRNFDRWFVSQKLYCGQNPNLKLPHYRGNLSTFRAAVNDMRGATPGVDYGVSRGGVMTAAAAGKVGSIYRLNTGRAGGMIVNVVHCGEYQEGLYQTSYAHLNSVFVKTDQLLERGQEIGDVTEHHRYAKMILARNFNFLNPDRYGKNHSYMDYFDPETDLYNERETEAYCVGKYKKQKEAFNELLSGWAYDPMHLLSKYHVRRSKYICVWSMVERYAYLKTLYKVRPEMFPSLSDERFQLLCRGFQKNQNIFLSLPLKAS